MSLLTFSVRMSAEKIGMEERALDNTLVCNDEYDKLPIKFASRVYVSDSPLHGKGLFASRHISKGTFIGTYEGPPVTVNGTYVLWVYEGDELTSRDGKNELKYINHSNEPNTEFDGFDLYAIGAITKNDEITINYHNGEAGS